MAPLEKMVFTTQLLSLITRRPLGVTLLTLIHVSRAVVSSYRPFMNSSRSRQTNGSCLTEQKSSSIVLIRPSVPSPRPSLLSPVVKLDLTILVES